MLDIVNKHFLTQHVKQPTRGHNVLVSTTYPYTVIDLKIQNGMSDHIAIIFDIKTNNYQKATKTSVNI